VPQLLWALGLIPVPVADEWSFVLDVIFCGLTNAALRYHRASNMPFWKLDKLVRRTLGPNPFRAHDAIGAKGANFLTWSCLHHLADKYGPLFEPSPELVERKDSGQNWYPANHFRPLVDWELSAGEEEELRAFVVGALVQMTALMVHEERAHFAHLNLIGELCAQLRRGVLALVRGLGADEARRLVERYHRCTRPPPRARGTRTRSTASPRPSGSSSTSTPSTTARSGVITLGREAYNWDVDAELNRAIDWLRAEGIERVILSATSTSRRSSSAPTRPSSSRRSPTRPRAIRVSAAWTRTARRCTTSSARRSASSTASAASAACSSCSSTATTSLPSTRSASASPR
jgi:hypothetical protein